MKGLQAETQGGVGNHLVFPLFLPAELLGFHVGNMARKKEVCEREK